MPHEKSTDCHVAHKQLFLIIGRRKESTSRVILGAMYPTTVGTISNTPAYM